MKNKFLIIFLIISIILSSCKENNTNISISSSSSSSSQSVKSTISNSSINKALSNISSSSAIVVDNTPIIKNDASGIPDATLYKAILKELGKSENKTFTTKEAETITFLSYGFFSEKIKDITGIVKLKNLTFLHLTENEISDISPLINLKRLKELNLDNNKISDISKADKLTSLEILYLSYNNITDISALSKLNNIKQLYLWYNNISDISPLSSLNNLTSLNLESNFIDMTDQKNVDLINLFKSKIKYFGLGLQGVKNTKTNYSSPVNLYIGRQQTSTPESNIYYVKVLLDGQLFEIDKTKQLIEPKKYTLEMWDNLGTRYFISFTIS